jgi:hypothetical protein
MTQIIISSYLLTAHCRAIYLLMYRTPTHPSDDLCGISPSSISPNNNPKHSPSQTHSTPDDANPKNARVNTHRNTRNDGGCRERAVRNAKCPSSSWSERRLSARRRRVRKKSLGRRGGVGGLGVGEVEGDLMAIQVCE